MRETAREAARGWFILDGALLNILAVAILSLPKSVYKLPGWSTQTKILTQDWRRWDSAEQCRPQETQAGKNFLPAHLGSAYQSQTKPNHPPKERMERFASKVIIAFQVLNQRASQHRPMLPGKFPEVWTNLKSVPLTPLPLPVLPFPCRLNSSSQHLTLIPLGRLHHGV